MSCLYFVTLSGSPTHLGPDRQLYPCRSPRHPVTLFRSYGTARWAIKRDCKMSGVAAFRFQIIVAEPTPCPPRPAPERRDDG